MSSCVDPHVRVYYRMYICTTTCFQIYITHAHSVPRMGSASFEAPPGARKRVLERPELLALGVTLERALDFAERKYGSRQAGMQPRT